MIRCFIHPWCAQVSVANATVLRLTRELAFIDEVLAAAAAGKLRQKTSNYFVDRCPGGTCPALLSPGPGPEPWRRPRS